MIQRIQTLFLLAVLVLSGLMFMGDYLIMKNDAGSLFAISFEGVTGSEGEVIQRLMPLSFFVFLVPVLSLVSIFLFRKRQLQMRVTMLTLLFSLGTLILGAFYVIIFERKMDITILWKIRSVFPLINSILAWLAYRGILKDDLLVKSYDRLR